MSLPNLHTRRTTRDYVEALYEEAERIRADLEAEASPIIADMFDRQLREIEERIEALEDGQPVDENDLLDFAFWTLEIYAILSVLLRRWVIIGYRFGTDVTGTSPGAFGDPLAPGGPAAPGIVIPPIGENDSRLQAFVESMRANNDHITENTKTELRRYLDDVGARFGEDLKRRTEQIINHFRQYFQRRGTSISEMNVNAAMLRGYLMAMIDAGVREKMWVSQRDATVRKSHVEADGQTVPIKSPFLVGGYPLMHPVDPRGPAQEIMRCRCFMVPVSVVPYPAGPNPT